VWPSRWLLPFSGAMMILYLILRIWRDVLRGPYAPKDEPALHPEQEAVS
jgi:hypothetical protein